MAEQPIANEKTFPVELRAVLRILTTDDDLRAKALPHVNIEKRTVSWPDIWANDFDEGHKAALLFACAIWNDSLGDVHANPFEYASSMGQDLRLSVVKALAMRWGVKR